MTAKLACSLSPGPGFPEGVLPASTGTRGQIGSGKRDAETVSAEIEDAEEKKSR